MDSRLILDGAEGARANLALEEAILQGNDGLVLRLWGNERSVIIGRAQLARFETDVERCTREGIPIVRRVTAGGAIYNGRGNINWSIFVGREFKGGRIRYTWGVSEVFRMAADVVVEAAATLGVKAWLDAPNRIVSAEGKVSGMAAYLSKRGLLCHGTLLLDADLEEAEALTRPSRVELERRYTRSRAMKVANSGIGSDAFIASMRSVVEGEIGEEIEPEQPTDSERRMAESLLLKYNDPVWNLGDPFDWRST